MIIYETIGATEDSLRSCLNGNCSNCLFKPRSTDCIHRLLSAALSVLHRQENRINHLKELSNSQQAEIERLKEEKIIACSFIPVRGSRKKQFQLTMMTNAIEAIENHAIKEYAEKLKGRNYWSKAGEEIIDNLVEEMKTNRIIESEENNNA